MASSSSPRTWRYRVFASFHGPDVRKTFLSHLRKQFTCNGISMFDDQGIERSYTIAPALTQAIRESRISIVVLSKNYASSSWCLDELLEIFKCKEAIGQIVMTVFYGVDPSDVRKQTGNFGKFFKKTCARKTKEERRRWSQALTDVGNIAGEHFQKWDNEVDMIEKIAKDVSDKLNATPSRDFDGMVGLEAHLREMESLLDLDNDGVVKMVAITGPAGIGKTTIARALQSLLSDKFQLTCFVDNIRGSYHSGLDDYGLQLRLQENLISKVFNQDGTRICHLGVLQQRLSDLRVLIILDDVNNIKQLEALANETTWFGPGSRIVVTTENKGLLQQHDHINNTSYHVRFPSDEEAVKILCRYAFRQNSLYHGFEKLALRVAWLCGNLPLGLRVVGSSLRGKKEDEWEHVKIMLETILDRDIVDVLRVGYDSLDENEQTLCLHIAVFFNYTNGDFMKTMFTDSDLDVKHGLKILVNRSLIEICTYEERILMHRLLQQVGKKAIRKQKPWKRQILMDAPEIRDVLEHAKGTSNVSGISFDISRIDEVSIGNKAFKRMQNLRFLKVYKSRDDGNNSLHIPEEMEFPRRLRLLHWSAYPNKSLPPRFHTEYLVDLDMMYSKLEKLWDGIQPLNNLKEMNMTNSLHLKELPDLSKATNLETLFLGNCKSLVELPELPSSFSNLHKLETLFLHDCVKLEVIPTNWNLITSLQHVVLAGCSRLPNFPCISTDMRIFTLVDTAVNEMPTSITLCSYLSRLDIRGNGELKTLPKLPTNIRSLTLSNNGFETISNCCIKDIGVLGALVLSGCRKLTSLPELPPSVDFLYANDCESLETVFFPPVLRKADLSFANCFKLGQQARKAIIQHSFFIGSALLPGSEVPTEFHHRAMGNTLTFHLPAFSSFKVCLVISPNQLTGEDDFPEVVCRRIRKGYLYRSKEIICRASRCRTKHLFIFHPKWIYKYRWVDVSREIMFEFSSKYQDFDITECGAQILTYETDGSNNYDVEESSDEEDDEDDEEGYVSESGHEYRDEDEGIADGDYESVSRKRPSEEDDDDECFHKSEWGIKRRRS